MGGNQITCLCAAVSLFSVFKMLLGWITLFSLTVWFIEIIICSDLNLILAY